MIKLDDNLLAELGLASLPAEEKKKMLAHIYETLEMRVGMELAKQMSDAQLNEFEQFINRNDESGALRWLETNFPNYKDVVAAEFEKLKAEIKQLAPQILGNIDMNNGVQPGQPIADPNPMGNGTGTMPQQPPQFQPQQQPYTQPYPQPQMPPQYGSVQQPISPAQPQYPQQPQGPQQPNPYQQPYPQQPPYQQPPQQPPYQQY